MSILFLLASLGVVNGGLVGVYLILRRQRVIADIYFGGLLIALSIRIGKSVFFYFNEEPDLIILQIGLSACLFIGPFFYLYMKSLFTQQKDFSSADVALLGFLATVIIGVGLWFPYPTFPKIWNGYIVYGIYMVWIFFALTGCYVFFKILGPALASPRSLTGNQQYLLAITVAMLFITCTYLIALFGGTTYIWGALIFTLCFYYLLGRSILTTKSITPRAPSLPLQHGSTLLRQVDDLMASKKLFTSQGLKLDDLAEQTGLTKHMLSRVLNEEYKLGFSQYVKEYRVNEAKILIHSRPELSLEGIGYEAGFNSKSAFFEAFKKITNCTPAEFKKLGELPPFS